MTRNQLHRIIVQRAGCDVLDMTLNSLAAHKRDIVRRLQYMEKQQNADSVDRLTRTLQAIEALEGEVQQ